MADVAVHREAVALLRNRLADTQVRAHTARRPYFAPPPTRRRQTALAAREAACAALVPLDGPAVHAKVAAAVDAATAAHARDREAWTAARAAADAYVRFPLTFPFAC